MAFLDQLVNNNPPGANQFNPQTFTGAYSSLYPNYEISTPQYPYPSAYNLINSGYRLNEIVYACIEKRKSSISEPPLKVYKKNNDKTEEVKDSPLVKLLKNPCPGVTGKNFWQITEITLLTSGFMAWEKERNRLGEVIALWPMRSDWCSFMRGEGQPVRCIRYQPYGLPPADVAIENVVLFQYYDPIYPLLKGWSPTAAALRSIGVDNEATKFLQEFFRQGSVISGVLSTDQTLGDIEARRIQENWKNTHGGAESWAENNIAVIGSGTKYQPIGTSFKDMAFQEIDGRTEARICASYKVPPILIGAKVGLNASTYSNYEEARKAYYEETVAPEWEYLAPEIDAQLVPEFYGDNEMVECSFDTSDVKALQENKDALWKRTIEAAKINLITRDEGREGIGFDPIDNVDVFIGVSKDPQPGIEGIVPKDNSGGEVNPLEETDEVDDATKSARADEVRKFRDYAAKRMKEGKPEKIHGFAFKFLSPGEQAALLTELPPAAWRQYP